MLLGWQIFCIKRILVTLGPGGKPLGGSFRGPWHPALGNPLWSCAWWAAPHRKLFLASLMTNNRRITINNHPCSSSKTRILVPRGILFGQLLVTSVFICFRGAPPDYSGLKNSFWGLTDLGLIKTGSRNTAFIYLLGICKEFHIHVLLYLGIGKSHPLLTEANVDSEVQAPWLLGPQMASTLLGNLECVSSSGCQISQGSRHLEPTDQVTTS